MLQLETCSQQRQMRCERILLVDTRPPVSQVHVETSLTALKKSNPSMEKTIKNCTWNDPPSADILKIDTDLTAAECRINEMTRQGRVFTFLERPTGWKCHIYHFTVFAAIIVAFFLTVWLYGVRSHVLFYTELCIATVFLTEYLLRLWSAGCRFKYSSLTKRLRFACRPICLIELFNIVASIVLLSTGTKTALLEPFAVRGFQFLHILQLLRIDRHYGSWNLLGSVVYMHRNELVTTLYISILGLIFGSYFMFLAERDVKVPEGSASIRTYADAMWWGVATFFTIGFGDLVPHSWMGKAVACISALALVAFFQLPAGILGSGFALKVHQKHRQQNFSRRIPAAAFLIQYLWQSYSIVHNGYRSATYNKFMNIYMQEMARHGSNAEEECPTTPMNVDANRTRLLMKHVIHAICKMKYMTARKKFQKMHELYDVRDIIEQYSQGHVNMMAKIKNIQRKIEQYIGRLSQPDTTTGQVITVNSRLSHIESQVEMLSIRVQRCQELMDEILWRINVTRHLANAPETPTARIDE